jgi:hypothetical protein
MNATLRAGGVGAGAALIGAGLGSVAIGVLGRREVRATITREKIVGTADMDPEIAGRPIDSGAKAKKFAAGMREHTLAMTGGKTYGEMPRYLDAGGRPTDDAAEAARDPRTGGPVPNAGRDVWVTSTALQTALTTSYFAEQVALFSIVMGIAMILIGIGFLILTFGLARRLEGARADASSGPVQQA